MVEIFSVKNLSFKYKNDTKQTINDISFAINRGEIFGFLGPSGAGKTTVQQILGKLHPKYDGSIKFEGVELSSLGKEYYQKIGVGFEFPVHYSKLTARENLDFFKGLYNSSIDYIPLCKRLDLEKSLDTRVSEFSKGMKMRLNFIRALLNNPEMLFLDEPTSGLDPVNSRIIMDIIREEKHKGRTIFLTTHLMHVVDYLCDRLAFIVDGKIVEVDTPHALKLKHGTSDVTVIAKTGEKKLFPISGFGNNQEFIKYIQENEIESIHSGESSLEEIFIKVTGIELSGGQ